MIKKILLFISVLFIFGFTAGTSYAQTCTAPAIASGVIVDYPGCNGQSCDLTQASCEWSTQADATSFNVTVTEVETGNIIKNNESVASPIVKVLFPITQGRTYKCDVAAVSSCGAIAAVASDQLLCEADAIIDTPTPTTPAQQTPPTATPTIAPPGSLLQTVSIIGGIMIVIIGGVLLFVL